MLGMGGEHGAGKMMVGCLYQNAAVSVSALHLEECRHMWALLKEKLKQVTCTIICLRNRKKMTCEKSSAIFLLCMSHLSCIREDTTYQL